MLKFANAALEILLEFGMRYPCQSLAIDKCRLLIRCSIFFYEFKLLNMNLFFITFVWLYTIHTILFVVQNLLYI
jgi:hypothetical protein